MLIRISLILAIIAALAVGVVNFFWSRTSSPRWSQDRDTQKSDKETAQNRLASTKKTLAKTQGELSTNAAAIVRRADRTQKNAEDARDKAAKRASDLADQLAKATQERDTANNELASYKATGFSPDQVAKMGRE